MERTVLSIKLGTINRFLAVIGLVLVVITRDSDGWTWDEDLGPKSSKRERVRDHISFRLMTKTGWLKEYFGK